MAEKVIELMEEEGVDAKTHTTISSVKKLGEKDFEVTLKRGKEG